MRLASTKMHTFHKNLLSRRNGSKSHNVKLNNTTILLASQDEKMQTLEHFSLFFPPLLLRLFLMEKTEEKRSSVCIFSSWEAKSIVLLFNFTLCDFKNEEECCSVVQKRRRSFSWTDAVTCWRELLCVFYSVVSPYRLIRMHMKLI